MYELKCYDCNISCSIINIIINQVYKLYIFRYSI